MLTQLPAMRAHASGGNRLSLAPAQNYPEIDMAVSTEGAYTKGSELAGKVALVTGAAKNIGRATALALAAGGATVAINTRASKDDAQKVAHEIRAAGGQAETYVADIGNAAHVKTMTAAILERFGRID